MSILDRYATVYFHAIDEAGVVHRLMYIGKSREQAKMLFDREYAECGVKTIKRTDLQVTCQECARLTSMHPAQRRRED